MGNSKSRKAHPTSTLPLAPAETFVVYYTKDSTVFVKTREGIINIEIK
jgi:hypothetical protein